MTATDFLEILRRSDLPVTQSPAEEDEDEIVRAY
jgi:hypothetical protein